MPGLEHPSRGPGPPPWADTAAPSGARDGVQHGRLSFRGASRAPQEATLGPDGDHRVLLYPHLLVLVVLAAQEPHGGGVLPAPGSSSSARPHQDEGQEAPVLGVAVRDEARRSGSRGCSAPSSGASGDVLGLLVEGDVDGDVEQAKQTGTACGPPAASAVADPGDALPDQEGGLLGGSGLRRGLHVAAPRI